MPERLLTLNEVAERLGVSRYTVARRVKDGSLRAVNISGGTGHGARWRIYIGDLAAHVQARRTGRLL